MFQTGEIQILYLKIKLFKKINSELLHQYPGTSGDVFIF